MHESLLGFVLLSAVSISACSVIPKVPSVKPPVDPPAADLSTLEVTVEVPYAVIAQELNRAIPNQLYWATGQPIDDCPVSECSYQVRVLRNGNISLGHDGTGGLVVNLPIRTAHGRIDAMKRVLGLKISKHADFTANVTATVTLGFTLQPNWSVVPSAQLAFHVHKAKVRIGFPGGSVGISVRGKITELLNGQRDGLQRRIVEALNDKVDFRSDAASAWSQLHGAQQLSDQPPVWLMADPVSLKAENPKAESDGLRVAVGIDAYLSTHVQHDAPTPPKPEALPNLKVVPNIAGRYKLSVPIRASVEEANQQLNILIGKEFTFKAAGKTIIAKLIDGRVYTNGPDLVVYAEVRVAKMLLGILPIRIGAYLNGTPKYDAESTTVHLDPFDYDADTNNLLLDKAEWFLHGTIRESLQAALRLNIGEDLDNARQGMAEKLRDMPLGERIVLHGTVDKLAPRSIYTTKEALNVDALAEGQIKVELKN